MTIVVSGLITMACVRNVFRMLFIACLHWRGRELSCHCARRPHEYERTRPYIAPRCFHACVCVRVLKWLCYVACLCLCVGICSAVVVPRARGRAYRKCASLAN